MYLYESCTGLYLSDEQLSYDETYCEQCGSSDWEIGYFENAIEALIHIADDIDVEYSGGWNIDYVLEVLSEFDDCPTKEKAIKIIKKNKTVNG